MLNNTEKSHNYPRVSLPAPFFLSAGAIDCAIGQFSHVVGAYEGPLYLPGDCQRQTIKIGEKIIDDNSSAYIEIRSVYCDEVVIHPWCEGCVLRNTKIVHQFNQRSLLQQVQVQPRIP